MSSIVSGCTIAQRRFPFPYRAGLAINSDIDLCPREEFVNLHRMLNDPSIGLGLPIADSFFGCAMGESQLGLLTMDGRPSPDAGFISECVESGILDTLHTWFDQNKIVLDPERHRTLALRIADYCLKQGLRVPIWVNHGSRSNYQNLRCRLYPHFHGDVPGTPYYTSDLLARVGIRYIWMTEVVSQPLSLRGWRQARLAQTLIVNALKNAAKVLRGRAHHVRPGFWLLRLAHPFRLRDGGRYWGFHRTNAHPRGLWTPRPSRRTLAEALSGEFLDRLVSGEGFAVIYTHLGLPVRTSRTEPLFTQEEFSKLESVARRFHDGHLWIAPTAHLLDYFRVSTTLRWESQATRSGVEIRLLSCLGTDGRRRLPTVSECAGLTFLSPCSEATAIVLDGVTLPVTMASVPGENFYAVGVATAPVPNLGPLG